VELVRFEVAHYSTLSGTQMLLRFGEFFTPLLSKMFIPLSHLDLASQTLVKSAWNGNLFTGTSSNLRNVASRTE